MKASGKSKLLADRYVQHQPRVIHLDPNDEIAGPNVLRAMGAAQLFDFLRIAAEKKSRVFNIAVTGFTTADVSQLLRALVPPEGPSRSLARAFGTLALECGEMGMLCQVDGKLSDALAVAMMNARHHGLSLFLATQYPYSLPVAARMNSDEVFFFQQDEPQALVWARQIVGARAADHIAQLRDHAFLLYERATGLLYDCDRNRAVRNCYRKDGAPVAPEPPPAPTALQAT